MKWNHLFPVGVALALVVVGAPNAKATSYNMSYPGSNCVPAFNSGSEMTTYQNWLPTYLGESVNNSNYREEFSCPLPVIYDDTLGDNLWLVVIDQNRNEDFYCWTEVRNAYTGSTAWGSASTTSSYSGTPKLMSLDDPNPTVPTQYISRYIMCEVPYYDLGFSLISAYQVIDQT